MDQITQQAHHQRRLADGLCGGAGVDDRRAGFLRGLERRIFAAAQRDKPVVEIDGDKVTVKVGEAAHPMDDDHYIQFLVVEAGAEQYAKCFKPGDVAEATFTVNSTDDVKALAFCNQHGLWSSE